MTDLSHVSETLSEQEVEVGVDADKVTLYMQQL